MDLGILRVSWDGAKKRAIPNTSAPREAKKIVAAVQLADGAFSSNLG
jgi:hypothetical protein